MAGWVAPAGHLWYIIHVKALQVRPKCRHAPGQRCNGLQSEIVGRCSGPGGMRCWQRKRTSIVFSLNS
jgi:hypothetical protein